MKVTLEQVTHDASELSLHDREILLARLIRDLDPVEEFSSAEIEEAWDKEIARRIEEIESGKVQTVPAEEVFARIQSRLDEAG
ncbi:MAG TPA: addiction module protein [Verrucomicrobiae bacterium]|nr:addiction module protein [Verrucomicrobiae bacterium]